jgi:hypothetical protein
MAKILVEYDTVEKTCAVKLGDKELPNVNYVTFSQCTDYDNGGRKWCASVNMSVKNKDDGVAAYSTIYASHDESVKKAIASGDAKEYGEGLVIVQEGNSTQRAIASAYKERTGNASRS